MSAFPPVTSVENEVLKSDALVAARVGKADVSPLRHLDQVDARLAGVTLRSTGR